MANSRNSYMPARKTDQVTWAATFTQIVDANVVAYGVPAPLMAQFVTLNDQLQLAWTAATQPATRTRGTVEAFDDALKAMKLAAKNLVSIIQGTPSVTGQMKIDAGLTVRKTHRSPVPPPQSSPYILVKSISGRTATIELKQSEGVSSKPSGVKSATVLFSPTGVQDVNSWYFKLNTTRTKNITVDFPASETGDTMYLTAFWTNAKDESGPAAEPVAINLPAGGTIVAKAAEMPKVKLAA